MYRVAAIVGADGYGIELHGLRAYELLGLSTVRRPHDGTFRVVRNQPNHKVTGDLYTALMILSSDTDDFLHGDSGSVVLTRAESGFDGRYVVYAFADSNPRRPSARRYVVRGAFHLRKY